MTPSQVHDERRRFVALISAGSAIVTALATQFLAARVASRSAVRAEQRETRQWQRTQESRQEELRRSDAREALEWERSETLRIQALQDARLRELWGHVLAARWQVLDMLDRLPVTGRPRPVAGPVSSERLPEHAAGQAYCVALIGLATVRPSAKAFYVATSDVQRAMRSVDESAIHEAVGEWSDSCKALEICVASLADDLVLPESA